MPLPVDCSDYVLVQKMSAGDEPALEVFYDRYKGMVYGLVLHMVADKHLAEEVTLDVFVKIWRQAKDYQAELSAVKTWLVTIARHSAIDAIRRRSSRLDQNHAQWAADALESLSAATDVERDVQSLELRLIVQSEIAALPPEQQRVLALAYFSGYSHSQIAGLLNQPLGSVKTRIRTAMQQLKKRLDEYK